MSWCYIAPPQNVPHRLRIQLPASKSIYNRLLIIRALANVDFPLEAGDLPLDSLQLNHALKTISKGAAVIQAGEGGTTSRFLLAYLCCINYTGTLMLSGTMVGRPLKPLVQALNALGARIQCEKSDDKLAVQLCRGIKKGGEVHLDASISSQFISALLLIGPYLSDGLIIHLENRVVSSRYITMTVALMQEFGISVRYTSKKIQVSRGAYAWTSGKPYYVEADWSAASYFWMHSHAIAIEEVHYTGLESNSLQGDKLLAHWVKLQGSTSAFAPSGWMCRRSKYTRAYFGDSFDGIDTPDLAMSHISLYAYMGFGLTYRGLSTLLHKESNRVMALQKEWQNAHRNLKLNQSGALILEGGDALPEPRDVSFRVDTHGDHRIAMCMSILAAKHPIWLKQPEVVRKSFPNFWDELSKLGYQIRFNTFPVS